MTTPRLSQTQRRVLERMAEGNIIIRTDTGFIVRVDIHSYQDVAPEDVSALEQAKFIKVSDWAIWFNLTDAGRAALEAP